MIDASHPKSSLELAGKTDVGEKGYRVNYESRVKEWMAVSWAQKEYQGYTRKEGIMGNNRRLT